MDWTFENIETQERMKLEEFMDFYTLRENFIKMIRNSKEWREIKNHE